MSEIDRIRWQIKASYKGPAWHGPSLVENLAGVKAQTAAAHPIPNAHSIWEIVLHVAAWQTAAAQSIERGDCVFLEGAGDWPPVTDTSEDAWKAALDQLDRGQRHLRDAVRKMPEAQLDQILPSRNFTYYILVHGVVQHNLYHAGQIAMLKKASARA